MNLDELIARAEIHDALLRYTRGIDRPNIDLVRSVFHSDAWIQFPESLYVGPVDGFLELMEWEMPRFARTMHFLGNSLIEFDGPTIAHVETYLEADHQGSEIHHWKNDMVKLWARYLDRFEKRDDKWLIASRRLVVDWMYRYPTEGWFDDHPDAHTARRDGNDPSLRPVAGFAGTPISTEPWPESGVPATKGTLRSASEH